MSDLQRLLESPLIWRGRNARVSGSGLDTGVSGLDRYLPDRGWPRGAITELQLASHGIGEISLLLPLMARLTHAEQGPRWVSWINPPDIPYAHALAVAGVDLCHLLVIHDVASDQSLWAAEQSLRGGHSPLVLLWAGAIRSPQWRRLQLAAEAGHSCGLVWQPPGPPARHVSLSLRLRPAALGIELRINRGRGSLQQRLLTVALDQPGQAYVL